MLDEKSPIQWRDVLSALGATDVTVLVGCTGGDAGDTDGMEVNGTMASEGTISGTTTGDVEITDGGGPGEGETVNAAWVYISETGDLG